MTSFSLKLSTLAAGAALMAAAALSPGGASAASSACSTAYPTLSLDAKVSGTSACEVGSTNNASVAQVNADTMFDFDDWNSVDGLKIEQGGSSGSGLGVSLNVTGMGSAPFTSGTWSVTGLDLASQDAMLVFKDGQDIPDTYVGYLLSALSGNWESPFINSRNGNLKAVSYISLYIRDASPVPLPAGAVLLISAFGLAAGARRMRRGAAV
jgi:hypothetical protein